MAILIINGSPRKTGNTVDVIEYIKGNVGACEVIDCCFVNIKHCNGCSSCKSGECIIDDDMKLFYDKIKKADTIIFASPLYFSMLTGGLLTFASRWQYFYLNQYKGKKKGGIILLGGGSTKDLTKAYSTAKIILRYVGVIDAEMLDFVGTDNENPMENADFIKRLGNFIDKIKD